MNAVSTIHEVRALCKNASYPLVLVPTMGALHEGHASLIRQARGIAGESGSVVVSIFVNPTQFAANEDLSRYPRTLEADATLCKREGADILFHPSVEEIYATNASVNIKETQLSQTLCGSSRPGHFAGVGTIVAKLFNIIAPTHALFGEKDWQQLAIIRRLVRDLNFPIEVIGYPIVREEDGLAISSRNAYLTPEERAVAPRIYQALQACVAMVQAGETTASTLLEKTKEALTSIPQATLDYAAIVDEVTLQELLSLGTASTKARLLIALKLGQTRLIDTISLVA